jgi:integrase
MSWSKWYLLNDRSNANGFVIKRYRKKPNGKTAWESLPRGEYKNLDASGVEALLRRKNASLEIERLEAESRYNFDHAYINVRAKERFAAYIQSRANDQNHVTTMLGYLDQHVFQFFVLIKKQPDPRTWHKYEQDWGAWLVSKQKLSASTIKQVVQVCNRFTKFLSTRIYPEKLAVVALEPLGRKKLVAMKESSEEHHRYKFISHKRFEEICQALALQNCQVLPAIILAYHFGLRISETYGLDQKSFYAEHLLVSRQLKSFTDSKIRLGPLKTLDHRKVPYWFMTPQRAYQKVKALKPMGPYTLNKAVNEALEPFGHMSHDLRRSFITRALRLYHHRDVQMAVGHRDIRTTLFYAQDDRSFANKQLSLVDLDGDPAPT